MMLRRRNPTAFSAALLVARVQVAEPGLQPVMLHEQFRTAMQAVTLSRDPMAGAGGVVKHQRQGTAPMCSNTVRSPAHPHSAFSPGRATQ